MMRMWKKMTSKNDVHVVFVSLLADQLSCQFMIFFGRPKWNCPLSGTGQFFLSTLLIFFCPVHWTIFFWLTKKNEKLTRQLVSQRDWPKPHGQNSQKKLKQSTFNRFGHSTNVSGIVELIVYLFTSLALLQFSLITSLQFFGFPTRDRQRFF